MSAKPKPKTPYQRLLEDFRDFNAKARYPRRITMWRYPKDRLEGSWSLKDTWERVAAAQQMGWRVELTADDSGLTVSYVEPLPGEPWYL